MADPKIDDAKSHVAVRLDVETLKRLSGLLPLYALPGRTATMSDVLRAVILAGIAVEERRLKNRTPEGKG